MMHLRFATSVLGLVIFACATSARARPQGKVTQHSYQSQAIGGAQEYYVYTPPGYDASRKELYPVLYLLHGSQGDARSWTSSGGADTTLDQLILSGKAKPMIVVMPWSFGRPLADGVDVENFARALLGEILPRVQATYHASPDRIARAVAGLSMGGGEALSIGLTNLDQFAWIGAFSPTSNGRKWPTVDAAVNARLKLLYLTCGTADSLFDEVRKLNNSLTATGVRVTFVEFLNEGHVWPLWSRNLADLAQLLFQGPAR